VRGLVEKAKSGYTKGQTHAIAPNRLRRLVQDAIEQHLPPEQFEVLKAAEASEREPIAGLLANLSVGPS
jgi:hypothetical protein